MIKDRPCETNIISPTLITKSLNSYTVHCCSDKKNAYPPNSCSGVARRRWAFNRLVIVCGMEVLKN